MLDLDSLLSWVHTHIRLLVIAAIVAAPVVALVQGCYILARYRYRYGNESPVPMSHTSGVVVVSPINGRTDDDSDGVAKESSSLSSFDLGHVVGTRHLDSFGSSSKDHSNGRFSAAGETSEAWGSTRRKGSLSDLARIRRAAEAPALRLLLIGDSLAAGVGVSKSATPVLPEVIAKSLSRALGGRAVFWTCIAEPGASSGWIVRELRELGNFQPEEEVMKGSSSSQRTLTSLLDEEDSSRSDGREMKHNRTEEGDFIDGEGEKSELDEWRKLLSMYSSKKTSEIGDFDVACVLTGLNDLKGAVMPWLLQGDEIEFRRAARERGGDYTSELKRVVDAVADKMKSGLRTSIDNIRDKIGSSSTHAQLQQPSLESLPLVVEANEAQVGLSSSDESIMYPLVVLPALPSNFPVMQVAPFVWFMLPLIHIADRFKRRLAERYPHAILYVEPSSVADMLDFENCRGLHHNKMITEDTLLSLKDKPVKDIRHVETLMKEYYEKKARRGRHPDAVVQPAYVRRGAPGASLLSLDGIHPSDKGYDFWGRCIAAAILREWNIEP